MRLRQLLELHAILLVVALWPNLSRGQSQPTAPPTSNPVPGPELRMVLTGNSGGLDSSSGTGDTILLLYEELTARGGAVRVTGSRFTLHDGYQRILAARKKNDVEATLTILRSGTEVERRVVAERVWALESDRALVIQYPPDPHLDLLALMEKRNAQTRAAPRLQRVALRLVELRVGETRALIYERHAASKKLRRDPLAWEWGWIIRGEGKLANRTAPFSMLIKHYAQGQRRARMVAELAAKTEGTLLLGGGNDVATRSRDTGKRAETRELDFDTLSKLAYDAYCPGYRELYFGLKELKESLAKHPLPMVATNLFYRGEEEKNKSVFVRYRIKRVGKLRVAFICLVDPTLRDKVRSPRHVDELEVRDPLTETTRVVNELHALPGGRPDLIVALSNLGHKERAKLVHADGVDLLLGNFRSGGRHRDDLTLDLSKRHQRMQGARGVAYVSRTNFALVGEIALRFDRQGKGWRPLRLEAKHHFVDSTLPRDEALHRKLMKRALFDLNRFRGEIMPSVETIIGKNVKLRERLRSDPEIAQWLPASKTEKWQLWMTANLWGTMVANLLLDGAEAEVAIVPHPRRLSSTVPGPILERYVREWLDKDEAILLYDLPGKRLRKLWRALQQKKKLFSVSGIDGARDLVGGRRLSDKESYRVAMAASVAEERAIVPLLKGQKSIGRFEADNEGARLVPQTEGKSIRLRELVVARLKWLRKKHGGITPSYLRGLRRALSPRGHKVKPRWTLSAENVSLSFASYGNYPSNAWTRNPGTRETRAVTPGNYALGVRGRVALNYDSAGLAWETAGRFKLSRVVIDLSEIPGQNEVINEPAGQDDIVASSELRLKFIELALDRKRHVRIVPYTQVAFDTEFTATKDQITGSTFPHQKQLRLAMGLVSYPGEMLKEVRFGGLFKNDFDRDKGQPEGGLVAGAKLAFPLWGARLDLQGALQYYFSTKLDTVEDLGLIFEGLARLSVPFTRTLSLSLFADLFVYQHKIARVTDIFDNLKLRETGVSVIFGAGLSFDHVTKL